MMHCNNVNNAHITIQHNTALISTQENDILILNSDIFIYMYSVSLEISKISTVTSRYSICCAANVYMFIYPKDYNVPSRLSP